MLTRIHHATTPTSRAIYIVGIGYKSDGLLALLQPLMVKYANKCNADIWRYIDEEGYAEYEKVQTKLTPLESNTILTGLVTTGKCAIRQLLKDYEQVLYLDTDCLILDHCPDLFELVPKSHLGIMSEEDKFTECDVRFGLYCRQYNQVLIANGQKPLMDWNGKYYNTGVMLVTKENDIFTPPLKVITVGCLEQEYLNYRIAVDRPAIFSLPDLFNKAVGSCKPEELITANIVHFCGPYTYNHRMMMVESYIEFFTEKGVLT